MEPDLQDALVAWQGGDLPAERNEALLTRLQTDAEFRQAFAEKVWTLSLVKIAQTPEPRWLTLYEELGLADAVAETEDGQAIEQGVMTAIRRHPLRFVEAWWRRVAVAAIAAALVLAVVLGIQELRHSGPGPSNDGETLAFVARTEHAVWAPGHAITGDGCSLAAGPIRLQSGRASLTFLNGTVLQFEGPANLELLAVNRVRCRAGRLHVRGTRGFCIETPDGSVTDLGTELGVTVAADGRTRVAVFDGKAEASVRAPGQNALRTEILERDQAVELVPTEGEIHPTARDGFLKASELRIPPLHLDASYAEVIRHAQPSHYWRLDREHQNSILNEISGGPELRLLGGVRIQADGNGGFCAVFSGRADPGALYTTTPWAVRQSGHAVEFWFASVAVGQTSLASFTDAASPRDHVALLEQSPGVPGTLPQPGIDRYLLRWPPGRDGGMNIFSPPKFLPYQWHHLVAQQAKGQMELFIDGQSVGHARTQDFPPDCLVVAQFGCLYALPTQPKKMGRCFDGHMAEIALYDHTLAAEEIRRHARLGGVGK